MIGGLICLGLLGRSASSHTPVLTYHDIIPKRDAKSVWFDCTAQEFEEQMEYFRRRKAQFLTLNQLVTALEARKPLPKNAVCITFADNYEGFYRYAWPIIQRWKIPVAQFVHTNFVGNRQGRPKMNWIQLRELHQSGLVTVASQTASHPANLTQLTDSKVLQEFRTSKLKLETELKTSVEFLAYPNGKYSRRIANLAKKAGYRAAFTEVLMPAEKAPNLWQIPRYVHTKYQRAWTEGKD